MVLIIPASLRSLLIEQNHDAPGAGHLGTDKTAGRDSSHWLLGGHVAGHRKTLPTVLHLPEFKTPSTYQGTITDVPVGQPWEMVAVDILELPVSYRNN